jgi:hypothetical protein
LRDLLRELGLGQGENEREGETREGVKRLSSEVERERLEKKKKVRVALN